MSEKITFKQLDKEIPDSAVQEYLESKGFKLHSADMLGRARDAAGNLTKYKNGDRFVYVSKPLPLTLPRKTFISESPCMIFHPSQKAMPCGVCNMSGHKRRSKDYPALNTEDHTIFFNGNTNVFSNFYPGRLNIRRVDYASSEHAYLGNKAYDAKLPDLAHCIFNAEHAGIAKQLGREICDYFNEKGEQDSVEFMKAILRENMPKSQNLKPL